MKHFLPVSDTDFRAALAPNGERMLRRLIERLYPSITRYLKARGAEPSDAEDAFYTGIIALWERGQAGGGFETGFKFYPFLLEACKHTWYKMLREKKNHTQAVTEEKLRVLNADSNAQEILEKIEFEEELLRRINNLSDPCRRLLLLVHEGLTYEMIVRKMGYASVGVVRKSKCNCIKQLKATFQEKTKK